MFLRVDGSGPRATDRRVWTALIGSAIAALMMTGCSQVSEPDPTPTAPSTSATSAPRPTPTPTTEAQGRERSFADVVNAVWGTGDRMSGRAYVDALVAAGFDKTQMQLTPDETSIGGPVDSIQFSVRLGEDCLVGQVGEVIGNPVVAILPGLATGGCLIGDTRPITW